VRLILGTLLAALLLAAPAAASRTQTLTFEAPRDLLDPASRPAAMAELDRLGVRALRVILRWNDVAPAREARTPPSVDLTDPASYDWGQYDALMAAARGRGWDVLLTPSSPVPRWATARRRDHLTRPSPAQYARFVTAAARRYGGQVETWSLWNEPNHPDFLLPQYSGRGGRGGRMLSAGIYRRLALAGVRALREQGETQVLLGETAPRGTGRVVAPITFLRGVLAGRALDRVAGWSHHAYTTQTGPFFVPPGRNDVTIGALSRLTRALDRYGRRGMPVYLTEFGIQSTPDRFFGVSLTRQQEYRALSEYIAWRNPRVRAFSQYLLRDDPPIDGVPALQRYGGFETGLRFANGRPKPALNAFRLPLAAHASGSGVTLWGLVRPARGATTATVLVQDGGRGPFRPLRTVRTDDRGGFTFRTTNRRGRRWLLRWEGTEGEPVRAYRR